MNPVLVKPEIVLFPQMPEVEKFLMNFEARAHLSPDARLTIDLETTGLDPHSGEITVVGMSDDGETVWIVAPDQIPVQRFNKLMVSETHRKVFHNAKFDMKWLMKKFGSEFQHSDCTYIMRSVLTTGLEAKADLKTLSWELLGISMDKEIREEFIGQTVITQEMAEYAALDVAATHRIYAKLAPRIIEEELVEVYEFIEKPLIPIVADMELTGIDVDLLYLARLRDNLEAKIVRFQDELNGLVRAFDAMPKRMRKLKVAEKKTWPVQPAPDYVEEEEENFNINSSKQVTSVLNLVGFTVKSSSKAILENPTYSAASMKAALKRLETVAKGKKNGRPAMEAPAAKPAKPKPLSIEEQIAALQAKIAKAEGREVPDLAPSLGGKASPAPRMTVDVVESKAEVPILWKEGMTEEDVLTLAYDITQRILDLRAARKAVDGFIIPMSTRHVNPVTGKVHTSLWQLGTNTGRFSNSEPNFQQMPSARKDSVFDGFTFREAFVPPAGYKMMIYDYQACEVRILAEMTQDKGLIHAMSQDDPHIANAAIMFDVPVEEVTKDMRTKAKTGIFTLVYGGGAKRIAAVLKCSVAQAQQVMDLIFAKFPGLTKWIQNKKATALERGYALSLSGRKRYFDMPEKPVYTAESSASYADLIAAYRGAIASIERQAQNAPIQATNADITKLAMVWVTDALKPFGGKILLTIHDELVAIAPEEHAEAAFEAMGKAMLEAEREFLRNVECKIDGKISTYWEH